MAFSSAEISTANIGDILCVSIETCEIQMHIHNTVVYVKGNNINDDDIYRTIGGSKTTRIL